jgi:hypothetical protein
MRPGVIEIANVVGEHCEQMALDQDDDVIETLPAYAAEEALTGGIHIWRAHGGLDDPRSEGLGSEIEFVAELAVPIADDELGPDAEPRGIAELLRRPLLGGSPCRQDVHDFARSDVDDEKGEDWPKPDVVGLDEVARPNVPGVIFEEGCPTLSGRARPALGLRYFWIVRFATRIPSLNSSPRIRSAPHRRFSRAMRRMSSTVSIEMRACGWSCLVRHRQSL